MCQFLSRLILATVLVCLALLDLLATDVLANNAELRCPTSQIRQIKPEDVEKSSADDEDWDHFIDVLSLSTGLSSFFAATDKPNRGRLSLKERFLLLGFSTQGYEASSDLYYVSQLSIDTNSSSPEYHTFNEEYSVSTNEETYFSFDEPVLVKEIHITVLDFVSPSSFYYWKLRIFGCKENYATQIEPTTSCPTAFLAATSPPALESSSVALASLVQSHQEPKTATFQQMSHVITVTELVSSCSVSMSNSMVLVVDEAKRSGGSSSQGAIVGAVVPLLLIIVILAITLVVMVIWIYKKRDSLSNKSASRYDRPRGGTLNEIPNIPLYGEPEGDKGKSAILETKNDDMVDNEIYLCASSNHGEVLLDTSHPGAAALTVIQEDVNVYSDIDHYYPSNTSNASSNKYEYVGHDSGLTSPAASSSLTTHIDDIDSHVNPSYSIIT